VFRTRKEAERAEREALTARDRGIDIAPERVTIANLVERYVDERVSFGRAEKTIVEYRRLAKLYIEPHLGSKPVSKTKPAHVAEWLADLRLSGGVDKTPLSAKTCAHAVALLSAALRWGVRMDLAGRDVTAVVTRPTVPKSAARAFENAGVGKLLTVARGTRWEAFIALALTTGARRAELLALDWSDVDLDAGTVTISKALCQLKARVFTKGTKTGSTRSVPLSRLGLDALRRQRALQAADQLAALPGTYVGDSDGAVFTNPIGERLTPQAATSAFSKIATKAKVSSTRLHSLRHSAATHLLAAGVDLATAAAVLGHATAAVTATVYAHVLSGGTRDAVDRLGDRLERLGSERTSG
jgi:integrase